MGVGQPIGRDNIRDLAVAKTKRAAPEAVYWTRLGLDDRLSQTVGITTTYHMLDSVAGLTQVLVDGTNSYLYGPSAHLRATARRSTKRAWS